MEKLRVLPPLYRLAIDRFPVSLHPCAGHTRCLDSLSPYSPLHYLCLLSPEPLPIDPTIEKRTEYLKFYANDVIPARGIGAASKGVIFLVLWLLFIQVTECCLITDLIPSVGVCGFALVPRVGPISRGAKASAIGNYMAVR